MEIKPTYVTFEQAKLLKEKGFDEITKATYQYQNLETNCDYDEFKNSLFTYDHFEISAPEQWQVVDWILYNYNYHIELGPSIHTKLVWYYYIHKIEKGFVVTGLEHPNIDLPKDVPYYSSKQEAYSAAFDYIFNNLI